MLLVVPDGASYLIVIQTPVSVQLPHVPNIVLEFHGIVSRVVYAGQWLSNRDRRYWQFSADLFRVVYQIGNRQTRTRAVLTPRVRVGGRITATRLCRRL